MRSSCHIQKVHPRAKNCPLFSNFFGGNTNGAKAAPQQSKLAFSNTAKPQASEKNDVAPDRLPKPESSAKKEDGDVKMEDAQEARNTAPEAFDHPKEANGLKAEKTESDAGKSPPIAPAANGTKTESPSPSRKRQASGDPAEDSDEGPPVKRKRLQQGRKKKQVKMEADDEAAAEKTDDKPVKQEPENTQADTPKQASRQAKKPNKRVSFANNAAEEGKASKIKRKATPKKKGAAAKDEDGDVEDAEPAADTPSKVEKVATAKEDEAEQSASDPDEADSEMEEDEEPPEQAAKKHEKVQSTLSSKTKDPYPDWKPGEPVPYAALCTTFSKIEMTTKRLEISAHCSLFIRQVLRLTPNDLLPVIFLMIGKLAADYSGIELGIGESLIMKAIGETTGRSLQIIKSDQNEIGDLGLVAAKSRSNQPTMFKPKPLTVKGVHEALMAIATTEGQGAQGKKVAGIKKLLSAADPDKAGKGKGVDITKDKGGASESKFIIRSLEGKMRLGLAERTVLVALSQAFVFHEIAGKGAKAPSTDQFVQGEKMLKSVFNELPSYDVIVPTMIKHGIFQLRESCNLQPGVPLKPMLARPTKSITEVLDRFEGKEFTCEYKYDGERAQIHFVRHEAADQYAQTKAPKEGKTDKGISNIFSRNSEDLSKKYPDVLERLPAWVKEGTKSFVLDCETVAWDLEEKKVLPFQQLMTRKRKDVKTEDIKVKVCVFAFDILYLNGEALVNQSFRTRREKLREAFQPIEGEFQFAQYGNTNQLEEIQTLLEDSVKASCEGLMVKMLDGVESHYEPSRRSQNWLKVKKDYLSGVGDSLDLVVLGAYYGKGKRTSVYGAFLLACYNTTREVYETVCNIGTGFSEEVLQTLHEQLEPIQIDKPKPFYDHSTGNKDQPDVWFEAKYVWEVKTADLTISPRYRASIESMGGEKGISLRFPRFLKVREDKKPEQATSSRQVAEMYRAQDVSGKSGGGGKGVDDDFEY